PCRSCAKAPPRAIAGTWWPLCARSRRMDASRPGAPKGADNEPPSRDQSGAHTILVVGGGRGTRARRRGLCHRIGGPWRTANVRHSDRELAVLCRGGGGGRGFSRPIPGDSRGLGRVARPDRRGAYLLPPRG